MRSSRRACRLLQLSPCSCAKDDDRQTTTCVKCRCPCRQQYQKVWPRSLAATTWWLTLAGRSWPSCIQADSHCSSVSERPCTELSAEPCHPSQRYRVTAAPPVCSTEHTCGPTLQTDHIPYGRRAFSVAGPTAWNSLPVAYRDPTISDACFRRHLKTVLFAQQCRHHSV